jgi:glutathione S-transferase
MADYSLHGFLESGNSYKAALMLTLCGADWRPVWVDFAKGETRTPEFRKLNEMGEVPVLVDHTDNDLVLTQSGVILHYLAEKFSRFTPQNESEKREIMRWILWDNHKFTANIATYRFLSHIKKKEGAEVDFFRGRTRTALKLLNTHLEERGWIVGDSATIADLSICGYLFWPNHINVEWKDYPAIEAWLENIRLLEHWAAPEALLPSKKVS